MFCTKCGAKIQEGDAFCTNCGAPVNQLNTPPEGTSGDLNDTSTSPEQPQPTSHEAVSSSEQTAKNSQNAPEQTEFSSSTAPTAPEGAAFATASSPSPSTPVNAAQTSSAAEGVRGFFSSKRNIGICIGAAAAAVAVIILAVVMSGALVMGQTSDKFKTAFQNDSIVKNGLASNTYLNDSPYQITDFNCTDIKKANNYEVTANITATIENANYKTEIQATGEYYDASKADSELLNAIGGTGYEFNVVGSTTTPKKGIDYDQNSGLSNVTSTLSDDAQSCTVSTNDTNDFWFATSSIDKTYTYTFNGNGWTYKDVQESDNITYKKDVEGSYAPKTNKDTLPKFIISNLDIEKGTFQIDYTVQGTYFDAEALKRASKDVSGTVQATIDTNKGMYNSNYRQSDGQYYYFQGNGNSDSGDGQASIEGYLTTTSSGEMAIYISSLEADYSYNSGGSNPAEYSNTTSYSNTVYKG